MLSGDSLRQTVHTHRASVHQAAKLAAALLRVARVSAGLVESNGRLPPGSSCHLQADCQEPRSAAEPYARQSSMDYFYLFIGHFNLLQNGCGHPASFAVIQRCFLLADWHGAHCGW